MHKDKGGPALPELGTNAISGQLGEALVESAMLRLGQLYVRRTGLDFGIDGVIEIVTEGTTKQASGREIGVQVKRGVSVVKQTRYGRTLYCTERHANYWLGHSLPIIVVHGEPESERLRWQHVNSATLRHTNNGYALDLPEESDLRSSLDDLRLLASAGGTAARPTGKVFRLPYSPHRGPTLPDEDLGLAALSLSRSALRGELCEIDIEIEGEADLVASIDAIMDITQPTSEQRVEAIIREDILSRYRRRACSLHRALDLLLTEPTIAALFGYQPQLLATAIRNTAKPMYGHVSHTGAGIQLDAWPGVRLEQPVVKFDVPHAAMDEFYERETINRWLITMGSSGGVCVGDLHPDIVATCFLPALVNRLIAFADINDLTAKEVLKKIEIPPSFWLIGIS